MLQLTATEEVNTTNGWGFGGWSGTTSTYTDGGLVVRVSDGIWYHRHTGTSKHYRMEGTIAGKEFGSDATLGELEKAPALVLLTSVGLRARVEVADSPAAKRFLAARYDILFTGTLAELTTFKP